MVAGGAVPHLPKLEHNTFEAHSCHITEQPSETLSDKKRHKPLHGIFGILMPKLIEKRFLLLSLNRLFHAYIPCLTHNKCMCGTYFLLPLRRPNMAMAAPFVS